MKCYAKSSENLIVQLANLPPKPPFLSKSFHLFSCIGIELGNAQNGTVDLGRFSLDNMESVTLYNGQK